VNRFGSRFAVPFLAVLAAALPAGRAAAEDVVDPVDAIEDQALLQESRAKFAEALKTFQKAFETAVEQAGRPGGEKDRERNLAVAEALLEKIVTTTESATKQAETEKFLEGLDPKRLGPVLAGEVDWVRARLRVERGDLEAGRKLASSLGVVRDWWVVGPFDNERGRGIGDKKDDRKVFAEKGVDLAGTYDGKDRKVSWRKVPVDAPLGEVNLDALMRPNDQALAYAVAFVKSDREQGAAIRLGSDEAVKVWWNGTQVLARDVRRPLDWDQDVVGVTLAAGWNALLLKVGDQTGGWAYRVRLTAPDGARLEGVTVAADAEEAKAALAAVPKTVTPFQGEVASGAKAFFEAALKSESNRGARDRFHLGFLHLRRHYDSIKDRAAERELKYAREKDPTNPILWWHYAEAAAPPIEMTVEKEENRQREARDKTVELDPKNALAWRALAAYYTDSLREPEKAEAAIRKALEVNPDWAEARLELARILEWRGLPVAAEKERDRVLEDAKTTAEIETAARAKAADLERRGLGDAATAAWKSVATLDGGDGAPLRRSAELLSNAAKREEALAALDRALKVNPYDTSAWARRADYLEGAGDLPGAEKALLAGLTVAPEDESLLQALGRVRWHAGRKDEALAAFREALRINPRLQTLERYLEILDPSAAPFEDDYRVEVEPLIAKAKDWANEENDPYVTLLDHTVTRVNVDGTSSTYGHYAAKVLTKAGQSRLRYYRAPAWGSAVRWKVARLIKPDGSVVEARRDRGSSVDFGMPEIGDVVDVEFRSDQREQSFFGDYFGTVEYLADQVPLLMSRYVLITPVERTFYTHQRNFDAKPEEGKTADGKWLIRTWTRLDAPKVTTEMSMPDPLEIYPQVQVSTFQDWNAFATWWWNLIRDQHILTDEMRAKVKELVKDKTTQAEKVRAIYDFVTGEITYQAWPAGIHGWKPYTATAILEKREGDCKDKAILFNTLLQAIDVKGYPVLIYADESRSEEDLTLPLINHFNHCIAYVPDVDGTGKEMWLDGTAQYGSIHLPPQMDRGAKVVVVRPEGAEVKTIPFGAPKDLGLDQKWDVTIDASGDAVVKGEITARGDIAVRIRRMFSVEGQRPLLLQEFLARTFGKVELVANDFDDLKDLSKPDVSFRVTAKVPSFAKAAGEARTLPTRFLEAGGFQEFVSRPKREHDLLLSLMSLRTTATYHLPEGWSVEAPPQDASLTTPQFSFTSKATVDGSTLTLAREIAFLASRVTKADYTKFREAVTKATSTASQTWKVKRAAGPAPAPTPAPAPAPAMDAPSMDDAK
jgi:tetratricopeptide (TPR) repeat protein